MSLTTMALQIAESALETSLGHGFIAIGEGELLIISADHNSTARRRGIWSKRPRG